MVMPEYEDGLEFRPHLKFIYNGEHLQQNEYLKDIQKEHELSAFITAKKNAFFGS